jgi:hypothetical protein
MAERSPPALVAGCAVVVKPAERVSHADQIFAEIMAAASSRKVASHGRVIVPSMSERLRTTREVSACRTGEDDLDMALKRGRDNSN